MQENEKHTPGSWETSRDAVPDGHVQVTVYSEESGERVATVFQTEANARLIAAAPDLLEAARQLVKMLDESAQEWSQDDGGLLILTSDPLRAAIAKAEVQA